MRQRPNVEEHFRRSRTGAAGSAKRSTLELPKLPLDTRRPLQGGLIGGVVGQRGGGPTQREKAIDCPDRVRAMHNPVACSRLTESTLKQFLRRSTLT